MGRHRLAEGQLQFYRAHVDIHAQIPADALSVSVNILHTGGAQGWLDPVAYTHLDVYKRQALHWPR